MSRFSTDYVLTRIVPGLVPTIVLLYFYSINAAPDIESVAVLVSLLISSLFFGELVDLYRIKVPYTFRRIIAEEHGSEVTLYLREKSMKTVYDKLSPNILTEKLDRVSGWVRKYSDGLIPLYTNFYSSEDVSEGFIEELTDAISVDDNYSEEVFLYEGLLSYLGSNLTTRTRRMRRRYIFLMNLRLGIVLGVLVGVAGILHLLNKDISLNNIVGAVTLVITLASFAVLLYQSFTVYFHRAEPEYIRSLIMDFRVKRQEE